MTSCVETATSFLNFVQDVEVIDLFNLDLIRTSLCKILERSPLRRIALTRQMFADELGDDVKYLHNVYYYPVAKYPCDLISGRFLFLCVQVKAAVKQ